MIKGEAGHAGLPDMKVSVRQVFGIDSADGGSGLLAIERIRAGVRCRLPVQPRDHARDPGRVRVQPPRDDPGLPRHRQIHAYRAGGGAAELALRAHQPRQPCEPHRPCGQGRHRHPRRPADHRVPRRHPALGAAVEHGARVRRVRRRPARRDVRDPARAGGVRASSPCSTRAA